MDVFFYLVTLVLPGGGGSPRDDRKTHLARRPTPPVSTTETFCCRRSQRWYNIGCEPGDEVALEGALPQRCWRCLLRDYFGPFYLPLRLLHRISMASKRWARKYARRVRRLLERVARRTPFKRETDNGPVPAQGELHDFAALDP
jgi:hypothetical protein